MYNIYIFVDKYIYKNMWVYAYVYIYLYTYKIDLQKTRNGELQGDIKEKP